jgi:DNA-binding protein H-NS
MSNSLITIYQKVPLFCRLNWLNLSPFWLEITMAKVNLSNMTVDSLMDLRKRVDEALLERRTEMEKQLAWMDTSISGERPARGRGRGSALKGRKVPPKYRAPSGETWAGRGARPRWLVDAMKGGKKLNDFLIDKSATKERQKRRSKR